MLEVREPRTAEILPEVARGAAEVLPAPPTPASGEAETPPRMTQPEGAEKDRDAALERLADELEAGSDPDGASAEVPAPPATPTASSHGGPSRGRAAPVAPTLALEDAVKRLPPELVQLFQDRLRGEFREVRPYQPRAQTESPKASASEEALTVDESLGEDLDD
ncbi:MAG: hypothetical protein ACLFU2_02355 [Opitutales bacterium]